MQPVVVGSGTVWVPFASELSVWGQGMLIWIFFKLKNGSGDCSDNRVWIFGWAAVVI